MKALPSDERFFEDTDNSGDHYLVPWHRREEWANWRNLPDDDEAETPDWVKRIDEGTLTFTEPRIEKW